MRGRLRVVIAAAAAGNGEGRDGHDERRGAHRSPWGSCRSLLWWLGRTAPIVGRPDEWTMRRGGFRALGVSGSTRPDRLPNRCAVAVQVDGPERMPLATGGALARERPAGASARDVEKAAHRGQRLSCGATRERRPSRSATSTGHPSRSAPGDTPPRRLWIVPLPSRRRHGLSRPRAGRGILSAAQSSPVYVPLAWPSGGEVCGFPAAAIGAATDGPARLLNPSDDRRGRRGATPLCPAHVALADRPVEWAP